MNFQRFIYFKTVAEHQHFTRAADALFITQPALSKAIQNLETELDVPLFEKNGRNVVLTKYGDLLYEYVKRSLDEMEKGILAVRHMKELDSNTIFINALYSMYSFFLPEQILHFRKTHPECRFSIEYYYTSKILNNVLNGHSELGVCSNFDPVDEYSSIAYATLYHEPICFIVGKEHPFASRKRIQVEELKNERFVVYFLSRKGTNKILYDICAQYGFEPNIAAEGYNDFGVINMVASGEGIAIVPASYLKTNNVAIIDVDTDVPLTRNINLIWRKDISLPPLVTDFRDILISRSVSPQVFIPKQQKG